MHSITSRPSLKDALTALIIALVVMPISCFSFAPVPLAPTFRHTSRTYLQLSTSSDDSSIIQLTSCSGEEKDIESVANFLVDAFWLQSPQQLILGGEEEQVSGSTRSALLEEQARDLTDKYGERLGKRLLESSLITALDGDALLGVVCIEVCLFDKANEEIVGATKSEAMIKNAVASLGPKQRRQYKDASVQEIATELLPPEISSICCLSNLAVSPNARRRGIAKKLCDKAEEAASEWGYDEMFLKVESDNTAAKELYENKLGYVAECTIADEVALRVDPDSGFVERAADTLVLKKKLQNTKEQSAGYI